MVIFLYLSFFLFVSSLTRLSYLCRKYLSLIVLDHESTLLMPAFEIYHLNTGSTFAVCYPTTRLLTSIRETCYDIFQCVASNWHQTTFCSMLMELSIERLQGIGELTTLVCRDVDFAHSCCKICRATNLFYENCQICCAAVATLSCTYCSLFQSIEFAATLLRIYCNVTLYFL
jgi:hypothetical protein